MMFSDRPPLAGDSLTGRDIERNSQELERPSLPEWAKQQGRPCLCKSMSWQPVIVESIDLPSDGSVRRMKCSCCDYEWTEIHEG